MENYEPALYIEVTTSFYEKLIEVNEPMEMNIKLIDDNTDEVVGKATLFYYISYYRYPIIFDCADNQSYSNMIVVSKLKKEIKRYYGSALIVIDDLRITGGYRKGLGTEFVKMIEKYLADIYGDALVLLHVHPILESGTPKLNKNLTQKGLEKFYKNLGYEIVYRKVDDKRRSFAHKIVS